MLMLENTWSTRVVKTRWAFQNEERFSKNPNGYFMKTGETLWNFLEDEMFALILLRSNYTVFQGLHLICGGAIRRSLLTLKTIGYVYMPWDLILSNTTFKCCEIVFGLINIFT
jgi:hypothetical protein